LKNPKILSLFFLWVLCGENLSRFVSEYRIIEESSRRLYRRVGNAVKPRSTYQAAAGRTSQYA